METLILPTGEIPGHYLGTLALSFPSLGFVWGDFNEIIRAEEKQGWLDRPERQMQGFRDAIDFGGLKDLDFNGFPFTWCNRRPSDQNVWVRLDEG